MKYVSLSQIILTSVIAAASSLVQAGISLQIAPGHCGDIQGSWQGAGDVKAGPIKCRFEGDGTIFGIGEFEATLNLKRKSGICPEPGTLVLQGTCNNETGEIVIANDKVNLKGSVDDLVRKMDLRGKIKVESIEADLVATLTR